MRKANLKQIANIAIMGITVIALISISMDSYSIYNIISERFSSSVNRLSMDDIEPLPLDLQNVHKIVCLGDSITAVTYGIRGYVSLLSDHLDAIYPRERIDVINAGVNGNRSTELVARFQTAVMDKNPDLLIINIGVNDIGHGFDAKHPNGDGERRVEINDYLKNIEYMLDLVQQKHMRIVILSPTTMSEDPQALANKFIRKYSEGLENVANKRHIKFVNLSKAFFAMFNSYQQTTGVREDILTIDGIHPNQLGQRIISNCLMTALGISSEARIEIHKMLH